MPTIRAARPADAGAIAEFTTDTFSWGDYVSREFPHWLDDPKVEVGVVTDEHDVPVALARVSMLSDREGWLSAARVHPDHRRRGLGSALNDWCVEWIRGRGGLVARLQIETWNEPAHNQVLTLGYRSVARVVNGSRPVGDDGMEPGTNGGKRSKAPERLDRAPTAEADLAYIAWSTSDLARAARGMIAVHPWAWRRMTKDDATSARVWSCPSGWIIGELDEDVFVIRWLVCTPDDADRLVKAAVDLAHDQTATDVEVAVPEVEWLTTTLSHHGFELFPTRLYEKPI